MNYNHFCTPNSLPSLVNFLLVSKEPNKDPNKILSLERERRGEREKRKREIGMELSSEEGEIPIPINSTYGVGGGHGNGHGGHMIHHEAPHSQNRNIISSSTTPPHNPSNIGSSIQAISLQDDHGPRKKPVVIRYRECLKNHAASMGGNATDGCGEFMPSGEEGTIEALNCSACHCHRNFHRKELEGGDQSYRFGRKFFLGHHNGILSPEALGYPTAGNILPSRTVPPHQMVLPYNFGSLPSESDEQEDQAGGGMMPRPPQFMKKRFRTKFTQEQKEKMFNFAEKVGWKIQKQEESVVQNFCQEIGVRRRVLKVWMHNNKHNLAKKSPPPTV